MILYIPGAGATSRSFAWLKREVKGPSLDIDYDQTDVLRSVEKISKNIEEPVDIVGHSLGGIVAVLLSDNPMVRRVVTLSSPFGGSVFAGLTQWVSPHSVLAQISPYSPLITKLKKMELTKPVFSLVTSGGSSPLFGNQPNDGVVTVESQKALYGPRYVERDLNHFEVLLDRETADFIKEALG